MGTDLETTIDRAAEAISRAQALLITAGAGIGVDSGLPDFRGNEGFWRAYPPLQRLGISFYDMANPMWFKRDPELAWGFYGHRLELYRSTEPHEGFRRSSRVGRELPEGLPSSSPPTSTGSSRRPVSTPTGFSSATARSTTCNA